jgi:hypothetical protein
VLRSTSATLRAAATEKGATFRCTLDGRAVGCARGTLAVRGLRPGTHEVRVAAVDRTGNRDRSPAVRRFTVPTDLRAAKGWKRVTVRGAWGGSVLSTSRRNTSLTASVARGTRSAVLIGSSPKRGASVTVYAGRTRLATLRLPRASTPRLLPTVRVPASFHGRLKVVVRSKGKPVRLDAVALVR